MPLDQIAEEIRARADVLQPGLQALQAGQQFQFDPEAEASARAMAEALVQVRGYELWVEAGRPQGQLDRFVDQARQARPHPVYRKNGMLFRRDGNENKKEALGFLKDWSTSLVQLDTAAIAAIGAFVGFNDFARSPFVDIGRLHHLARALAIAEVCCIGLSALSFFISLVVGLYLLNALPGAAQRIPFDLNAREADVFSIANEPNHTTIAMKSKWLRACFLAGAFLFTVFIGIGLWRAGLTANYAASGL